MNEAPDFLMEEGKNKNQSCDLERLSAMVSALDNADNKVKSVEEELKEIKSIRTKLSQETIPEYLNQFGLSELRLNDGRKIIVKDDVSVTVKDKQAFFSYLKQRKEDSIVKFTVSFDRMDTDKKEKLFNFLLENDYECSNETKVHSQTQKKYFKELLGIGKEPEEIADGLNNGTMVRPESIEGFAKVFAFKTTKIQTK